MRFTPTHSAAMIRQESARERVVTRGAGHLVALCLLFALASCGQQATDAGPGAPSPSDSARPWNVILIVVDTLRQDHLSCHGHERATTPNLDALAASGVRYENAISQAPWTTPSIGSLLSSQYPSQLGIRSELSALAQDVLLLPEVLDAEGFVTAAIVSHSYCSSRWGFDQGFDYFDESNVRDHAAVTSEQVTNRALAFLDEFGAGDDPFFLWLHYFDPHCAYVEHEQHDFGGPGDYDGPVRSGQLFHKLVRMAQRLNERDLEELRRLYDSDIAFTDAQLGRLFDRLERDGRYADTLLILTADHGEAFMEHGWLGHARNLHRELISVPLILRAPGLEARVEPNVVGLIDIFPTILDALGLPGREDLMGASILPGAEGLRADRVVFSETQRAGGSRAAVGAGAKLIEYQRGNRRDLFDLRLDPKELQPLALLPEQDELQLGSKLTAFRELLAAATRIAPEVALDAADQRRLNELGYGGDDDEDEDAALDPPAQGSRDGQRD